MYSLPPLNAVRAFEAAGRHLSFTRAGLELHVTHGAVSRQVAALEAHLGVKLFIRTATGLVLTERGRAYLAEVSAALDRLRVGSQRAADRRGTDVLRLSVPPTFAMRWLIPRLAELDAARLGIALDVSTGIHAPDFAAGGYDAAIRRIARMPRALAGGRFMLANTEAVCSPAYREEQRIAELGDLWRATLITTATEPGEWERWFRMQRESPPKRPTTIRFEQLYYALQAAVASLGVALAPRVLVDEDLAAGRLVIAIPSRGQGERWYAILYPRNTPKRTVLKSVTEWLVAKGRPATT